MPIKENCKDSKKKSSRKKLTTKKKPTKKKPTKKNSSKKNSVKHTVTKFVFKPRLLADEDVKSISVPSSLMPKVVKWYKKYAPKQQALKFSSTLR